MIPSLVPPSAERSTWVAIAYGALNVGDTGLFDEGTELVVLPIHPAAPLALLGEGASLWRRLVHGPLGEDELTSSEIAILQDMAALGLASTDLTHPARVLEVTVPWLTSPLHEFVYALVASVARDQGIPHVFLKGPVLQAQGLRHRRHSGDVDVLVPPDLMDALVDAMAPWGWSPMPEVWGDIPFTHSVTLGPPPDWGCQIDVHRRMPGTGLDDTVAFNRIHAMTDPYTFASVRGCAPTRPLNAVLAALHAVRPRIGQVAGPSSQSQAVEVLRAAGPSALNAARTLDALRVLELPLTQAFPGSPLDMTNAGRPRDWDWRTQPTKARAYWVALREVPWYQRPALALRFLWPSREAARSSDDQVGAHSKTAISARFRRLRRGLMRR